MIIPIINHYIPEDNKILNTEDKLKECFSVIKIFLSKTNINTKDKEKLDVFKTFILKIDFNNANLLPLITNNLTNIIKECKYEAIPFTSIINTYANIKKVDINSQAFTPIMKMSACISGELCFGHNAKLYTKYIDMIDSKELANTHSDEMITIFTNINKFPSNDDSRRQELREKLNALNTKLIEKLQLTDNSKDLFEEFFKSIEEHIETTIEEHIETINDKDKKQYIKSNLDYIKGILANPQTKLNNSNVQSSVNLTAHST